MLRNHLGFDGVVMTDWGATKDRILGLKAGIDLDMPGDVKHNELEIIKSINNNTLSMSELDTAVSNILKLIFSFDKNKAFSNEEKEELFKKHQQVALDIALDSAVLLKNNDNILPLKKDEKVLVVGELFEKMRYQGAGSSCMNPYHLTSPKQAFDESNINYEYVKGYKEIDDQVNETLEQEALLKSVKAEIRKVNRKVDKTKTLTREEVIELLK
jgi:beta-glucosidase